MSALFFGQRVNKMLTEKQKQELTIAILADMKKEPVGAGSERKEPHDEYDSTAFYHKQNKAH